VINNVQTKRAVTDDGSEGIEREKVGPDSLAVAQSVRSDRLLSKQLEFFSVARKIVIHRHRSHAGPSPQKDEKDWIL
jgi:hypothetical protein